MRYNIIGDVHGRNIWKELVKDDSINIFLGDYLDPYPGEGISDAMAWSNFLDILAYRQEHPDTTVLLWGNHDLHYIYGEHYSRFSRENAPKMQQLYESHQLDSLKMAYLIGGHTLVTHAGVTDRWWKLMCKLVHQELAPTPETVCTTLNTLGSGSPQLLKALFGTENTFEPWDCYGESPTASPIWVRPETLTIFNIFEGTGYKQIVGHTQAAEPFTTDGITFADCLGQKPQSVSISDGEGE